MKDKRSSRRQNFEQTRTASAFLRISFVAQSGFRVIRVFRGSTPVVPLRSPTRRKKKWPEDVFLIAA